MKLKPLSQILLSSMVMFTAQQAMAAAANVSPLVVSQAKQSAPSDGWAGQSGGTTGGSQASADHIYRVNSVSQLRDVLKQAGEAPKIVQIDGTIDISEGKAFQDFEDQKKRGQVKIPSNTTLIGIGSGAKFINGSLSVKNVDNVILRNFTVDMPVDVAPQYEEGDGWNAEWDGLTLDNARHVWVDHLTMSDGSFTDDKYQTKNGETWVQHDGMLDIKNGSDFVTISWNYFHHHDKTMLIGHSDKNGAKDQGKFHITIHDSVFEMIEQRAPRIRFGQVHSYNNLFTGTTAENVAAYRYLYTFGLGFQGAILSEHNQFDIAGLTDTCKIIKVWSKDGSQFSDKGSYVGEKPWSNVNSCPDLTPVTWTVPYQYKLLPVEQIKQRATSQAGAGKLS